jgi:hypothetical protein
MKGKSSIATLATIAACFFTGCAATPLSVENNAPIVAKKLGVSGSDITYLGRCTFGQAPPSGIHVTFTDGVVVLTRDMLVLMADKLPDSVPVQRMKFREMRGIDLHHFGRGRQLQILTSNGITVIDVIPTTEQVYNALRQRGVPEWKSEKHYLMNVKGPIFIPIPM